MIQSLVDMVGGTACEQCLKQAKGRSVVERVCYKAVSEASSSLKHDWIPAIPSYLIGITNAKLSGSFLEPQS